MKQAMSIVSVVAALCGACAEEDDGGGEALAWPCGAERDDGVRTTITWDDRHRITHARETVDGAPLREERTAFSGAIPVREEITDHAAEDGPTTRVVERDVDGSRILTERRYLDGALEVVEQYRYDEGELYLIEGTWVPETRGYVYDVYRPAPDAETRAFHWVDASAITYMRTRGGGDPWTLEVVEESGPSTRHVRRFDAGGWLVWEEKRDRRDGGDALDFRREVTRRDDGAPLGEVLTTAEGVTETTYLFACAP